MATERKNLFDVFEEDKTASSDDYDSDKDPEYSIINEDQCSSEEDEVVESMEGKKRKRSGCQREVGTRSNLDLDLDTQHGSSHIRITRSSVIQTLESDCESDSETSNSVLEEEMEEGGSTEGLDLDSGNENSTAQETDLDLGVQQGQEQTETPKLDPWSENLDNFPTTQTFQGISGLHIPTQGYSALSCFRLFCGVDLLKIIKTETNRYAAQLKLAMSQNDTPNASKGAYFIKNWRTLTLKETKGFILLLVHMSVVKKLSINDYWAGDEFFHTPFAARIMTRDRFKAILSLLHFNNNDNYIPVGQDNHDPLFKIKPVYDHLQQRFQEIYTPDQNIAIGEAMCPWRGRLRFKVYLKDKPNPWGIKFYQLCESSSGYVYRFEIYAAAPDVSNKPTDVVLRLIDPLLDKGYHLFCDNYYTCPDLFHKLTNKATLCTGTVRANRKTMPSDLATEKLQTGQITFRRQNKIVALHWKDKRDVRLLTSAYSPTETVTKTTRNTTNKIKPLAVAQYTQFMSGVDHSDQLISYVPLARRTHKWPTKLFMHLLTLCIIQAKIIHDKLQKANQKKCTTLPQFVKLLGTELKHDFLSERAPPSAKKVKVVQKPQDLLRLDTSKFHYLESLPPTSAKAKPRRDCKVCYDVKASLPGKTKRAKETYHRCAVCDIPLCIEPCFKYFHTEMNYICAAKNN